MRIVLVSLLGIVILLTVALPGPYSPTRANQRNASASLKTLVTAQNAFRVNDSDGNSVEDYLRSDIAGLYVTNDAKLLELYGARVLSGAAVAPTSADDSSELPGQMDAATSPARSEAIPTRKHSSKKRIRRIKP